jgi:hypothetical protein
VNARSDRPRWSDIEVSVTVNGKIFPAGGRLAQLVAELVLHQERVNEPRFGKLEAHFGSGAPTLFLTEGLPALWLQPH